MSSRWPHATKRRMPLGLALALVLCAYVAPAVAQEDPAPDSQSDSTRVEGQDEEKPDHGTTFIPFPVVFYQPETGFGFGASLLIYYRFNPADTVSPPSSMAPIAIYTTKNQIIIGAFSEMYLAEDRWRITSNAGYSKFPNKFWGIGNDTPDEAEEDYTPVTVQLLAWPQKRIADGWFAGFGATLVSRDITEVEEGGLLDSGLIPGSDDGQILGLRGSLVRDTRTS